MTGVPRNWLPTRPKRDAFSASCPLLVAPGSPKCRPSHPGQEHPRRARHLGEIDENQSNIPTDAKGSILGAVSGPQKKRMDAGIYSSLYLVLVNEHDGAGIFFWYRDLQTGRGCPPRIPLSIQAWRAGCQGVAMDWESLGSRRAYC